ncbi:hypothetical protein DFH08DRAFT_868316, partial [Mycena albidolilacea]
MQLAGLSRNTSRMCVRKKLKLRRWTRLKYHPGETLHYLRTWLRKTHPIKRTRITRRSSKNAVENSTALEPSGLSGRGGLCCRGGGGAGLRLGRRRGARALLVVRVRRIVSLLRGGCGRGRGRLVVVRVLVRVVVVVRVIVATGGGRGREGCGTHRRDLNLHLDAPVVVPVPVVVRVAVVVLRLGFGVVARLGRVGLVLAVRLRLCRGLLSFALPALRNCDLDIEPIHRDREVLVVLVIVPVVHIRVGVLVRVRVGLLRRGRRGGLGRLVIGLLSLLRHRSGRRFGCLAAGRRRGVAGTDHERRIPVKGCGHNGPSEGGDEGEDGDVEQHSERGRGTVGFFEV